VHPQKLDPQRKAWPVVSNPLLHSIGFLTDSGTLIIGAR